MNYNMKQISSDNDRYSYLQKYGHPNPMSLATANPQYFPESYINELGYWAYILYKSRFPFIGNIIFLTGDPVTSSSNKSKFISQAINELKVKGKIVIIQAHKETVVTVERLFPKFLIHQFGYETQVNFPINITDQIGTKVRQALKEKLYVEEIVFSKEDERELDAYYDYCKLCATTAKYQRIKLVSDADLNNSNNTYLDKNDPMCDIFIDFLENKVDKDNKVQEFIRKIRRYKKSILPDNVRFYYDKLDSSLKSIGYTQNVNNLTYMHILNIYYDVPIKKETPLLRGTVKCVNEKDLEQLMSISKEWLNNKTNHEEMGPPMLKPYIPQDEPYRRFFVARNIKNDIVAFVDFDRIDWSNNNGIIDIEKRGYYTNLVRSYTPVGCNEYLKNVRFLIIAAAAKRFYAEGYSFMNLGLSPITNINEDNIIRQKYYRNKLTVIENIFNYISTNKTANHLTFNYNNVTRTKQQNWKNCEISHVYLVIQGGFIQQLVSTLCLFIRSGVITQYSFFKIFKNNEKKL